MSGYRIGIVGCGGIANRHIDGYRKVAHDLGEVVAGCDPNVETLNAYCDRHGVDGRFTDPAEMIASGEVDVISLLTPPAVRGEVIFPAVEKGIHLLVEKPFGESLTDAVSFVQAAEAAGVVMAVNHQMTYTPDVLGILDRVQSGAVGDLRHIAHDHYQNRTTVRGWRANEKRLEISIFSIHLIDRIRLIAGRPPKRVSSAARSWNAAVQGETFTELTVQFEGDLLGSMTSNWHSMGLPECRLRVDGTTGSLLSVREQMLKDEGVLKVQGEGQTVEEIDCTQKDIFVTAMGESMKQLLDAARRGTQPLHHARGNLHTMQIVDAAYLSAERGGEMVEVEEIEGGGA